MSPIAFPRIWGVFPHIPSMRFHALVSLRLGNLVKHCYIDALLVFIYLNSDSFSHAKLIVMIRRNSIL
jgi:hypothetical protein